MLRRRDGRDRIELEEAEAADRLEDSGGAAVEALRTDGDPPRLVESDRYASGRSAPTVPHRYVTSSSPSTRARRVAARSSFASTLHRDPGSRWKLRTKSTPSARSAFTSARPTMRSPASSGST